MVTDRVLGYKKQGSRLRSIKSDKEPKFAIILKTLISILIGFVLMDVFKNYAITNSNSFKILLSEEIYLGLISAFKYSLCIL